MLVRCAKGIESNTEFKIVKVEQLAKHITDARTKCWKVVVPFKFKEMMEKNEMYPPGWCHRKFFAPRRSPNPAKQPRKEDNIVQQVIQDQQRAAEAKRQEEEDMMNRSTTGQTPLNSTEMKDVTSGGQETPDIA